MSSANYNANKAAIDQFRKELLDMVEDISRIDIRVLNGAVNEGVEYAKSESPIDTGYFKKNWGSTPVVKSEAGGAEKDLVNGMDYASYVNYGHRIVDKAGNTTGYVKSQKGDHLLERTINYTHERMIDLFKQEVEAVQKRHDK